MVDGDESLFFVHVLDGIAYQVVKYLAMLRLFINDRRHIRLNRDGYLFGRG